MNASRCRLGWTLAITIGVSAIMPLPAGGHTWKRRLPAFGIPQQRDCLAGSYLGYHRPNFRIGPRTAQSFQTVSSRSTDAQASYQRYYLVTSSSRRVRSLVSRADNALSAIRRLPRLCGIERDPLRVVFMVRRRRSRASRDSGLAIFGQQLVAFQNEGTREPLWARTDCGKNGQNQAQSGEADFVRPAQSAELRTSPAGIEINLDATLGSQIPRVRIVIDQTLKEPLPLGGGSPALKLAR